MIEFPPYRLDRRAGRLWGGDRPIALRPKGWALLCYLAERPGALVTKDELQAAVWGDTARVHAEPVSGPEPPAAALVGRDPELARLWASFRQASAGQRQVVVIHGEPGIGKTAVVEAFLHALRASAGGVRVGYGQCVEQLGEREPSMPALEALERLSHGPAGERLRAVLRAVAPTWLARMPSLQMPADVERLRRALAVSLFGRHLSVDEHRHHTREQVLYRREPRQAKR